jgi:hypothetical protein
VKPELSILAPACVTEATMGAIIPDKTITSAANRLFSFFTYLALLFEIKHPRKKSFS